MEAGPMKPFITPEITQTGKQAFLYQCEGIKREELWHRLSCTHIIAYAMPERHTFEASWEFSLIFDSGMILDFSSACTQAIDWQEVGSLNISATQHPAEETTTIIKKKEVKIPKIELITANRLIYEDNDIMVECGIIFHGKHNQEVIISTGIPPGSVTIQAPFSRGHSFKPEFALNKCRRLSI